VASKPRKPRKSDREPVATSPRERLLDQAVQYTLERGLTTLSLRALAKPLGTSARMLIHHFGSRDGLIAAVLAALEQRMAEQLARLGSNGVEETLRVLWRSLDAEPAAPLLRATYEIWGRALICPNEFQGFLQGAVAVPWRTVVRDGFVRKGHRKRDAEVRTTLIVGALSGLQMLKLSGADPAEVDAAFRLLNEFCSEAPAD
jgi:AcrR family transcriptional regulator